MSLLIKTYIPQHLSFEGQISAEHGIFHLIGSIVNTEIKYENDYYSTWSLKKKFDGETRKLGVIFNYLVTDKKSYGQDGNSTGWLDVSQGNQRKPAITERMAYHNTYYDALAGHRDIHARVMRAVANPDILDETIQNPSIHDIEHAITKANIQNFDRYLELFQKVTHASFWYDWLVVYREHAQNLLDKANAWDRAKENRGWEDRSPLAGEAYEICTAFDLKVYGPKDRKMEDMIERDLETQEGPRSGLSTAIGKACIEMLTPDTFCKGLIDQRLKLLEQDNLITFKTFLNRYSSEYFVTHSNHSSKLTDEDGLELEKINVTFQGRSGHRSEDLVVAGINRRSGPKQLLLFDDCDDFDDHDWDDDSDDRVDGNGEYSQDELDNHANQCNPNNDAYHSSRE